MNKRWLIYLTERFPVIPNALIALGITLSSIHISGDSDYEVHSFVIAVFGGMVFLAQIRFMDEYKDFEKDRIAHPERPLPRGLFSLVEFSRFIRIFQFVMIFVAALAAVAIRLRAGIYFAIGTLYLFLMFREFYLSDWLGKRPILYAGSHQLIIVPMVAFVLECFIPNASAHPKFLAFAGMLLFSFFGFEVGRKLNPAAHPILNTYLKRYGREKTAFILLASLGLAVICGERVGIFFVLGPLFVVILLFLSLLWWAPYRFKWVEGWVTLFLLLSIWGLPIYGWFK